MTKQEMEVWLVQWFNQNAAGFARSKPFCAYDDVTLVLMAFDLAKLAGHLVKLWESEK